MIKEKLKRLRDEKDTRRLILTILGGKMIGILAILGAIKGFFWFF